MGKRKMLLSIFCITALLGLSTFTLTGCKIKKDDTNDNIIRPESKEYTITFNSLGGTSVDSMVIKDGATATEPAEPTKEGCTFGGWYKNAECTEIFSFGTEKVTENITLYANWITKSQLRITEAMGHLESAYAEWNKLDGVDDYKVFYKKKDAADSTYIEIDKPLIREYPTNYRADVVGLTAGDYTLKVVPVNENGNGESATVNVVVSAHDRSGYAFDPNSPAKDASGAYKTDGTLKSGAQVIYVTAKNAKTVTAKITNGGTETTVKGLQAILTAKQKKDNKDILDIRMIGEIKKSDLDSIGSSSEGLQIKGAAGHQNMNLTIEGIGEDATVNGFGFLIRNCANVELRNFGIVNFMDDGVSIDTDNSNLWIHNLDIFYGNAGGDSDQAKGDGSLDCKKSQWCTFSYNHFWDSGKCCLLDAGAGNGSDYITYHHNWFDHSDSRHPRVRNAGHVHVYNNYYDGNSKYGVGSTTGSSTFVEANYFRNCKNPMMISLQGTDAKGDGTFSGEIGGMIKAYGNHIEGAASYMPYSTNPTDFDCVDVANRNDKVDSSIVNKSNCTYNNFDTASEFYSYTVDTAEEAKVKVEKYAGRINGGDLKWDFDDAVEDTNYGIVAELKTKVVNYATTLVRILGEDSSSTGGSAGGETGGETGGDTPTPTSGTIYDFNNGTSIAGFTITGNTSNSKGSVTYNGTTYNNCLKMESSTSIEFNLETETTVILVFGGSTAPAGKRVKVDGKVQTVGSDGTVKLTLAAGKHTITKGDSINLFLIVIQ